MYIVYVHICLYGYIYISLHICVHINLYIYVYLIFIYKCVYTHFYIFKHIHIHINKVAAVPTVVLLLSALCALYARRLNNWKKCKQHFYFDFRRSLDT